MRTYVEFVARVDQCVVLCGEIIPPVSIEIGADFVVCAAGRSGSGAVVG